jgi:hypothetical protein
MNSLRSYIRHFLCVATMAASSLGGAQETSGTLELAPPPDVADIQRLTEELWGHELGAPITILVKLREEVSDEFTGDGMDEDDRVEIEKSRLLLSRLDLIAEDTPLSEIAGDFYQQNLGGYYDPEDKSLHLIGGFKAGAPESRSVLSHEIVHALQDSKYDLIKLIKGVDGSDAQLAARAIVEGDASQTEGLFRAKEAGGKFDAKQFFAQWEMSVGSNPKLQEFPPFIVQDALFPYIKGGGFLTFGTRGDYPAARAAVFTDMPKSTEQILHPAKYWGKRRDDPIVLSLGDAPEGWVESSRDTFGEWSMMQLLTPPRNFPTTVRVSLDAIINDKESAEAAQGWGGDRLLHCTAGDRFFIAWDTSWDTATDARQFDAALRRRVALYRQFAKLDGNVRWKEPVIDGDAVTWTGEGRVAIFSRTRTGVRFVLASDADAALAGESVFDKRASRE